MALDSVGNPRIDFAWGNFPMQPDDKRGLPLGGSYDVLQLDDYGDAQSGRITFNASLGAVTVGSIIKLTGLVNGVDAYGNPLPLANLNRNYLVTKVEVPMAGYGPNTGVSGVIAHVDAAFQQLAEGYVYYSTTSNPPAPQLVGVKAIVDGAGVIGGGAGDYGWSQTTPVNSSITTAANNPFENIQDGWNGYPGYLGGDVDDVPGGVVIPNTAGQSIATAGETLALAGFVPGAVTNDKAGWTIATDFGTRYMQMGPTGTGQTSVQFYGGDMLTTTLSPGSVLAFNFTAANMGNYSYFLNSYPDAIAFLNSRTWTLTSSAASNNWFYAVTDGEFTGPTPNTWTDNYNMENKNIGIGSITTTENTDTVKRTVPAAGKTAAAGSYVNIVKYGAVASGQISGLTIFSQTPGIENRLAVVVKPEDMYTLNLLNVGQFVTVSGITNLYLGWYDMAINKSMKEYVDLSQVNKSHEIEFIDMAGGLIVLKTTFAEVATIPTGVGFNASSHTGQTTLWSLDA